MSRRKTMSRIEALLKNEYSLTEAEKRELQSLTRELFGPDLYDLVAKMDAASAEYHKAKRSGAPPRGMKRSADELQTVEKYRSEYQSIMEAHWQRIDLQELKQRLSHLDSLLNHGCAEDELHAFLAENVSVMLQTPVYNHYLAVSKPHLAEKHVPDFALYGSGNGPWWTFVEIEKPSDRLFTDDGDYSARLFHAIRQVHDWQIFINGHFDYYLERFGSNMGFHFHAHPNFLILIGRRSQIDNEAWQKLSLLNSQGRGGTGFYVATFDFLLEFKRHLDDIGFLGDAGERQEFHMMRALSWREFQKVRRCWENGSSRFW